MLVSIVVEVKCYVGYSLCMEVLALAVVLIVAYLITRDKKCTTCGGRDFYTSDFDKIEKCDSCAEYRYASSKKVIQKGKLKGDVRWN